MLELEATSTREEVGRSIELCASMVGEKRTPWSVISLNTGAGSMPCYSTPYWQMELLSLVW